MGMQLQHSTNSRYEHWLHNDAKRRTRESKKNLLEILYIEHSFKIPLLRTILEVTVGSCSEKLCPLKEPSVNHSSPQIKVRQSDQPVSQQFCSKAQINTSAPSSRPHALSDCTLKSVFCQQSLNACVCVAKRSMTGKKKHQ